MTTENESMLKRYTRAIHRGDYIAVCKLLSGEWTFDLEHGEIYINRTHEKLKFRKNESGYLETQVSHNGRQYKINKHRAIFVIGNGFRNIPEYLELEVDHINGDKNDCRFSNLRLLTPKENMTYAAGVLTYEQADEIREEFAKGNVTKAYLARKYGCSDSTISRIISRKIYVRVTV